MPYVKNQDGRRGRRYAGDARADEPAAEVSSDAVALSVGRAIRAARRRAGLTLAEVAERGRVTQPFLSQVENGRAMPSLLTLHRVAEALGVSAQTLVAEDAGAVTLVRKREGTEYERSDVQGAVLERFLVKGRRLMEPGEVWAAPGSGSGDAVSHEGEELIYMLAGRLEVELKDVTKEVLNTGDCLYYPATVPHSWRVKGNRAARFLVIATPASF